MDSQNPHVNKKLGVVVYAHNPRDGKMGGGDQWPPEIQGPACLAYLAKFQANKRLCLNPKVLKGIASTAVPLPTYTRTYTHTSMHTKKTKENLNANYINDTTLGCTGSQDSIVQHGRYQPHATAERWECGRLTTI